MADRVCITAALVNALLMVAAHFDAPGGLIEVARPAAAQLSITSKKTVSATACQKRRGLRGDS
jgi:hypothetical protein